jgi:hypothetical protein
MLPKKYKKAYIDNMLVKSMTFEKHIQDLHEVFSILHIRPMYWLPREHK